MIVLLGIAEFGIFRGHVRQCRLDLQDYGCFLRGLVSGITEQGEHGGNVLHVGIAKLLRFLVVARVVFALRQTEPAL